MILKNSFQDITENSLKMEDLINGNIYIRGTDIDGKHIMFFRIRLYARGSRTLDELQIFFLYWVFNFYYVKYFLKIEYFRSKEVFD